MQRELMARVQMQRAGVPVCLRCVSQVQCFCDKNWWHMDDTCATPGAHEVRYPYACPTDYLYWPGRFTDSPAEHGPAIDFRVPSFLEHPDLPRAVKVCVRSMPTTLRVRYLAELHCTC